MSIKDRIKSMLFWGFTLWLVGYVAGIVLFFVAPKEYIGWIIAPFATVFTIWVLMKKIKRPELMCYFGTGMIWTMMAVALDFVFIVTLFKAGSSYYEPDVLLYYVLTFSLPLIVGYWKFKRKPQQAELF